MGQVNRRGRFSTLHSSKTPGPIFMKLEIYNYFPDTTQHAKFQGPTSTWVVWANSQFDAWKFLSFFSFHSHAHRSHFWTHPNAQYVIIRRFRQGSAFWGLDRVNLKFEPLVHGSTTQVASRDMTPRAKGQRSRSQRNVTYPVKNCNNSVLGGRIKFILGS